jgi:membrane protein YdbS with pleckstrin-like domain
VVFPRRLLFEGEDVVVELRPHWVFLGWPLVATVAAVVLALSVSASFDPPVAVSYVLAFVVAVPALWMFGRAVRWRSTSVTVTTNRIVERWGVFSRRADEVRLDAVNQISYHQGVLQRLVRVGTVFIEVPGRSGVNVYRCLPRPDVVQRIISEQTANLYRRGIPGAPLPPGSYPTPGAPGPSNVVEGLGLHADGGFWDVGGDAEPATPPQGMPVAAGGAVVDAMAQLDELRRRGLLSEGEYTEKRAELLRRL